MPVHQAEQHASHNRIKAPRSIARASGLAVAAHVQAVLGTGGGSG